MTATANETASKVPVFSLPQTELLTVNVNEIPVLKDSLGPGIDFQPLFLDPEIGVWAVIGTFAPGIELPIHLHTGPVHGYTLKGEWIYKEYPDQPQTAGSYLYEPASSVHTFAVPETAPSPPWCCSSSMAPTSASPRRASSTRCSTRSPSMKLTEQCAQAQGIPPVNYLTGGSAKFSNS